MGSGRIVIVDIDGTVSRVGERLKYLQKDPPDWDSFYEDCFEDEPVPEVLGAVVALAVDYQIVFCTGRRESVRDKTAEWLLKHGPIDARSDTALLMRADGDHRHDTEVKPELLEKEGICVGDVAFIIEDRNSMVKKWREMGFICLQPFEGDF